MSNFNVPGSRQHDEISEIDRTSTRSRVVDGRGRAAGATRGIYLV